MPSDFYQCGCDVRTEVTDSRVVGGDGQPYIRRRRQCPQCKSRFTTIEVVADAATGYRSRVPYDAESARQDRKLWNQKMIRKLSQVIRELLEEE